MKAHIIYANFLKPNGEGLNIGGIETYIHNLSHLLKNQGFEIIIYQRGDFFFEKQYGKYKVVGVPKVHSLTFKYAIFAECEKRCNSKTDIVIFASDEFIIEKKKFNTIGIQHGISWDIPVSNTLSKYKYLYVFLKKMFFSWRRISRANKVKTLICVDYNYVNWYRALTAYPKTQLKVIPNFTNVPVVYQTNKPKDSVIKIIFARRFQPYRGTRLFAGAIERLLKEYDNLNIVFAGEGPDESFLHEKFANYPQVKFTKYDSQDSLKIHSNMNIAVVPTIGSEGTSLSLLEAMASGCAVIATNIGGLTDILINRYNGMLIEPNEDALYEAMKELINNDCLRKELSQKGYDTVSRAFSLSRWENDWIKIVNDLKR